MATTVRPPLPEDAAESLEATTELGPAEGAAPAGGAPAEPGPAEATYEGPPVLRLSLVVACSTLAAAVMSGGVFMGVGPRIWAGIAGLAGVALAARASTVRRPLLSNLVVFAGLVAVGLLAVLPTGTNNLLDLAPRIREAVATSDVLRPPVEFLPGWRALLAWIMAGLGFSAASVAIELRRPALGALVPLPVVAICAISVPDAEQLASGLVALGLFAAALGLLSSAQGAAAEEQRPSLAYEARRAARAVPLIGVVTIILYLLAQTDFLFPRPLYDPAQEAQRPKTVPLSEVEDRVLFRVSSAATGPWRIGTLDAYDGEDWRLPPFAESNLAEVPRGGIVDDELRAGVRADFEIAGLDGAVLPGLPNLVGVVAVGPRLAYDDRTGSIRLAQGQVQSGLSYTVTAGRVPPVEELLEASPDLPSDVRRFLEMPPAPALVRGLVDQAPEGPAWERLEFLRQRLLRTVVASGAGTPVSVPPERVEDLLFGSQEGTPFEIVAGQVMLARWAGIPARIGYGYDGGELVEDVLEVRPAHGASWLEVYFPGYKWLPVMGDPLQARTSMTDEQQQFSDALPSDEVAVQLFLPVAAQPRSMFLDNLRRALTLGLPVVLGLLLLYYAWPALWKAVIRARRRSWARQQGAAARVSLAYAEWRDLATDFGYLYYSDTPLMFLDRVAADEEHAELAWLVTRTMWGDLRAELGEEDALIAEELSRSLRKRLGQAHPFTMRLISAVSRLSLQRPFAVGVAPGRLPARVSRRELQHA